MAVNNRDKILKVAESLFEIRGWRETSLEEIIVTSGVSKSNLYYYFKTKEEIGAAVTITQHAQYQKLALQTLRNEELAPKMRLAEFFQSVSDKSRSSLSLLAYSLGSVGEPLRGEIRRFAQTLESDFAACLGTGHNTYFRSDLNTKLAARLLVQHLRSALGEHAEEETTAFMLMLLQKEPELPHPVAVSSPSRRLRKISLKEIR